MELFIFILELIGTVAFALSGAIVSINKNTDIFGVTFLGITTAVGGGVLRDIILGEHPPKAFVDSTYVLVAGVTSVLVFAAVYFFSEQYQRFAARIDSVNNVFDAIGLGVFTVYAMDAMMRSGRTDNLFLLLFVGMISGVGGGIIRDTLINEIPFVLRKRVYAVASLSGGLLFYLLMRLGVPEMLSFFAGIAAIFAIRMLATRYQWNLPRPLRDENAKETLSK